jgi:hypothetical protein
MDEAERKHHRLFWQAMKQEIPDETQLLFDGAIPVMDRLRKASASAEYANNEQHREDCLREMHGCYSELERMIWSWAEPINLAANKWRDQDGNFFAQTCREIQEALEVKSPFVIVTGARSRGANFPVDVLQEMEWRTLQSHIRDLDAVRGMEYLRGRFHRGYLVIKLPADGEMMKEAGMRALRKEFDHQLSRAVETIQWKESPAWPDKETLEHFFWAVKSICRKQAVKTILEGNIALEDKAVEKAIREVKDAIGYLRMRQPRKLRKKIKVVCNRINLL